MCADCLEAAYSRQSTANSQDREFNAESAETQRTLRSERRRRGFHRRGHGEHRDRIRKEGTHPMQKAHRVGHPLKSTVRSDCATGDSYLEAGVLDGWLALLDSSSREKRLPFG